ncbi:hypothetical protein EDC02_2215 [Micromonospora sp. Llam0]|uniref:hypothetical protein n=1 Tax=Micromonospora sp. Llam0 TaxID=2485143 RepID=UPI000F468646|nr:hypothetical protein [Micromonospora sp. Llam0]ROO60352.1 hypothetical protein EDC02_2215 [Micromonospora sp. Llam0]
MAEDDAAPHFDQWYDAAVDVGAEGNQAFFGREVLTGLVQGIRDFQERRQERWEQYHGPGTTLLGCAMWMDDSELLDEIAGLEAACVVVTKQPRGKGLQPSALPDKLRRLAEFNKRTHGLPVEYFPQLEQLTTLVDGKPPIIGPGWTLPDQDRTIPTVRTIGFRKGFGGNGSMPPLLHAKLALLGRLWDHDEDDLGPADVTRFTAKRLWVGSANFTAASRRSLEFGFWTEEPVLLRGAEEFLLQLIATSEGIDPDAHVHEPQRRLPDYDDAAMAEWAAELDLDALAREADEAERPHRP